MPEQLPSGSQSHGRGLPSPLQHLSAPLVAGLPDTKRVHARLEQQPRTRKDPGALNGAGHGNYRRRTCRNRMSPGRIALDSSSREKVAT